MNGTSSRQATLKAGVLLLVWIVITGLALVDTVDLSDEMALDPAPLTALQQAVEPDLDDTRNLALGVSAPAPFPWISLELFVPATRVRPASEPHDSAPDPLFQRLSTYRI